MWCNRHEHYHRYHLSVVVFVAIFGGGGGGDDALIGCGDILIFGLVVVLMMVVVFRVGGVDVSGVFAVACIVDVLAMVYSWL